jgi:signal transduction histidine kinase
MLLKKIENERDFQQLINATVSHEMRNPLNSIINLTKDLQRRLEEINSVIKLDEEENGDNHGDGVLRHYMKEFMENVEGNCKRQNSSS